MMSKQMPDTLGDALPREIERVQKIITIYEAYPEGRFAAALMRTDINTALQAMAEGDIIKMTAAYQALKGYEL